MGAVKLWRLNRAAPECWRHWPALRAQILAAANEYRVKNPERIAMMVELAFMEKVIIRNEVLDFTDTIPCWYAVNEADEILGHAILADDWWNGDRVAFVLQIWAAKVPRELQILSLEEAQHWARARGLTAMMMYTRRPSSLWAKRFAFHAHRVCYRHEIPPVPT
jgi:hypothetical protein